MRISTRVFLGLCRLLSENSKMVISALFAAAILANTDS